MTFSSLTLVRQGQSSYQVTFWADGIGRWDGRSILRMGAWQVALEPEWLGALAIELGVLPAKPATAESLDSILIETPDGAVAHSIVGAQETPNAWRIGMLVDGMTAHAGWVPFDVTDKDDFAPWGAGLEMTLSQASAFGRALALANGVLVLAGSRAHASTSATLEPNYKDHRAALIHDGGFQLAEDSFLVTRHLLFDSPSAAASVLAGSNTNGRRAWRSASGASWADLGLG